MLGRLIRYKIFLFIFIGMFVLFTITLVFATVNYLEFYVALNSLYLKVESFKYEIIEFKGEKLVRVNGNLTLQHNSSYKGLILESVYVSMSFKGDSKPFLERRFWLDGVELAPFSSIQLVVKNQNLTENIEKFIWLKKEGESAVLTVKTAVFIYIFGGPFATKIYLKDSELII